MAIVDYSLESTSHTVQWLPMREECEEDDRFTTEYFLMGTHNEPEEGQSQSEVTDYIMLCSVNIPKLDKGVSFKKNEDKKKQDLSKIKVVKSIEHPLDVSKARAQIGNPELVASFTNDGDINLYDFAKEKLTLSLKGHNKYGFGLCWQPTVDNSKSNILISAGTDSKVAVWDINARPSRKELTPLNTITYHKDSVNCVDVLSSNPDIFGTVSDDSKFALWDMRNLKSPTQNIKASKDGLNAMVFCPHDENTFLTGGQEDGEIFMWDMRKLLPMKPISSFVGHTMSVTNITFSPLDNTIFCSGAQIPEDNSSSDQSNYGVIVWDISKIGEEVFFNQDDESKLSPCLILSHDGHESTVDDISWSPYDHRTLSTVDGNKSINIFQVCEELFMSPAHYEKEFADIPDDLVE